MMLFGRSLFAGATSTGHISLAGVALCSAVAVGGAQALYLAEGDGAANALADAAALRSAFPEPEFAHAQGAVTAAPSASFNAQGEVAATAEVFGAGLAHYYAQGVAPALGDGAATLYRRVRMPFQRAANGVAAASAQAESYILLGGKTAIGRAKLVGTTYHVGNGVAAAAAELFGEPQKQIGERQEAQAIATAIADVLFTAGMGGQAGAHSVAYGDAAVISDGTRRFEFRGDAAATATALLVGVTVYQPQVTRGYAHVSGGAVQSRGMKGIAAASAEASGYMDMTFTGETGLPALVAATASAQGKRLTAAHGEAAPLAVVGGEASARFFAAGVALAHAVGLPPSLHILLPSLPPALAGSSATAAANKAVEGSAAAAVAQAEGSGANQVNDLIRAPLTRTVAVGLDTRKIIVGASARLLKAA